MIVEFSKKFDKQTQKIKNKRLKEEIKKAIESAIAAKTSQDILSLKKLSGYKNHYRIRIGDYRIGLYIEGNTVSFEVFAARKDIYKHFPE